MLFATDASSSWKLYRRNTTVGFSPTSRGDENPIQVRITSLCKLPELTSSVVRGLYPLESRPGLISLLAGKPNSTTFPLTSIELTSRSPTDPAHEIKTAISGATLAEGLQYGPTAGLPSLIDWVYGLQERVHGRKKGEGWRVSIGSGSQDVIYKACSPLRPAVGSHKLGPLVQAVMAMVNPGEPVLVESPVYA